VSNRASNEANDQKSGDGSPYVTATSEGHVLVVHLSRPAKLNVYDGPGLHAIGDVWQELDDNPDLRVGVLAGAGDNFCAGADVRAAAAGGFDDPPYPEVAEGLSVKPVIAAIEGVCLGGGMMIATGCDLRLASTTATFGLPETRWNLPAQWLGALARQVLPNHIMELALLADTRVPAHRLHEMGWLNQVTAEGEAFAAALEWADRVASMAPAAVRAMKELAVKGTYLDPAEALALGHEHARRLIAMEDTIEGAMAFAEDRPPRWRDK
jgi:enoyl-CoA hydratase